MYTCVYIFASTETLNNLYRKFKITMVSIVTRDHESMGHAISGAFEHRTYTVQKGVGGRSGESYWMVRTIITHEELARMIVAIERADSECFYYHHDIEGVSRSYYISPIG